MKQIELEEKLRERGFGSKYLLNNRGLIGAVLEELEEEFKKAVVEGYDLGAHRMNMNDLFSSTRIPSGKEYFNTKYLDK